MDQNGIDQTAKGANSDSRQDRRTSRLAIVGFAVSFFGFFFPAGALAVILGIMARKEVEDSPDRFRGRGLATAAMVIAITLMASRGVAFIYYDILPQIADTRRERIEQRCRSNLAAIASAIDIYRAGHEGAFPVDLQALADGGYAAPDRLRCPAATGAVDPDRVDETGGYAYRHLRPDDEAAGPLAWDSQPRHGRPGVPRANILYVDGRVDDVPAFELYEALEAIDD